MNVHKVQSVFLLYGRLYPQNAVFSHQVCNYTLLCTQQQVPAFPGSRLIKWCLFVHMYITPPWGLITLMYARTSYSVLFVTDLIAWNLFSFTLLLHSRRGSPATILCTLGRQYKHTSGKIDRDNLCVFAHQISSNVFTDLSVVQSSIQFQKRLLCCCLAGFTATAFLCDYIF